MKEPLFLTNARFEIVKNAGKARCEPGWRWRPQPLNDYDLWYVVSGKGQMSLDGKEYLIGRGDCFLVRPGDEPFAIQDAEDRLTVVFIHLKVTDIHTGQTYDPQLLPKRHTVVADMLWFDIQLNRLLQCVRQEGSWQEAEYDLVMKQVMLNLLRWQHEGGTVNTDSRHKQVVAHILAYIREDTSRRPEMSELANLVNLSPEYLNSIVKKYTGTSIKQWITIARLERALHLLMETPMNVSEVAESLGYANLYLFSRQFKERYGEPPSHFKGKTELSRAHKSTVDLSNE